LFPRHPALLDVLRAGPRGGLRELPACHPRRSGAARWCRCASLTRPMRDGPHEKSRRVPVPREHSCFLDVDKSAASAYTAAPLFGGLAFKFLRP
jgi:hypothetical protein